MQPNSRDEIVRLLRTLGGRDPIPTIGRGQPNWVIRVDRENAWVETEKSRRERTGPQPIPLDWIVDSYETLKSKGTLSRSDLGPKASKRSAFIFAVLAQLPDVAAADRPITLHIK